MNATCLNPKVFNIYLLNTIIKKNLYVNILIKYIEINLKLKLIYFNPNNFLTQKKNCLPRYLCLSLKKGIGISNM